MTLEHKPHFGEDTLAEGHAEIGAFSTTESHSMSQWTSAALGHEGRSRAREGLEGAIDDKATEHRGASRALLGTHPGTVAVPSEIQWTSGQALQNQARVS